MTDQLALTYSPSLAHVPALVTLGESALVQVLGRASLLECALGTVGAVERATGRHNYRIERRAWSEFGAALMELDLACRRLEGAGLVAEAADLDARKDVRVKALERTFRDGPTSANIPDLQGT